MIGQTIQNERATMKSDSVGIVRARKYYCTTPVKIIISKMQGYTSLIPRPSAPPVFEN